MKNTSVRLFTAFALFVAAIQLPAATLVTRFNTDPLVGGWLVHGTNNLFAWDSTNQNLQVTWDSSKPNNFFALPLGATYSRTNDFLLRFDLNLSDIAYGTTPGKDSTFQIAVGLMNLSQATNANFIRGTGTNSLNLVEWNYFPDPGWGAGISTPMISSTTNWAYNWTGIELDTNASYRVQMIFTAADQTLRTTMTSNGLPVGTFQAAVIWPGFGDFALDTFAISSYNDDGQDPIYGGSVLAHGTVDNLMFTSPLPVQTITQVSASEVSLLSDVAWNYTLESTTNFLNWFPAAPTVPGNGATLVLQATNAPADHGFYRVRADLP